MFKPRALASDPRFWIVGSEFRARFKVLSLVGLVGSFE